jgi:hypothetical protein
VSTKYQFCQQLDFESQLLDEGQQIFIQRHEKTAFDRPTKPLMQVPLKGHESFSTSLNTDSARLFKCT